MARPHDLRADDGRPEPSGGGPSDGGSPPRRLSPSDRQRVLVEWNQTAANFPRDRCLHQLVEERVDRQPDALAVVDGATRLTYRELDWRANRFAEELLERGRRSRRVRRNLRGALGGVRRRHLCDPQGGRLLRPDRPDLSGRSDRVHRLECGRPPPTDPASLRIPASRYPVRAGSPGRRPRGFGKRSPSSQSSRARSARLRDSYVGLDRPPQGRDDRAPERPQPDPVLSRFPSTRAARPDHPPDASRLRRIGGRDLAGARGGRLYPRSRRANLHGSRALPPMDGGRGDHDLRRADRSPGDALRRGATSGTRHPHHGHGWRQAAKTASRVVSLARCTISTVRPRTP